MASQGRVCAARVPAKKNGKCPFSTHLSAKDWALAYQSPLAGTKEEQTQLWIQAISRLAPRNPHPRSPSPDRKISRLQPQNRLVCPALVKGRVLNPSSSRVRTAIAGVRGVAVRDVRSSNTGGPTIRAKART